MPYINIFLGQEVQQPTYTNLKDNFLRLNSIELFQSSLGQKENGPTKKVHDIILTSTWNHHKHCTPEKHTNKQKTCKAANTVQFKDPHKPLQITNQSNHCHPWKIGPPPLFSQWKKRPTPDLPVRIWSWPAPKNMVFYIRVVAEKIDILELLPQTRGFSRIDFSRISGPSFFCEGKHGNPCLQRWFWICIHLFYSANIGATFLFPLSSLKIRSVSGHNKGPTIC